MKHVLPLTAAAAALSFALASPAVAQVKVGGVGPITGPNARLGTQLTHGLAQAAADINAAGGILGEKIEIVMADDASDPKQGVSVANRFSAQGTKFVLGNFVSGVAIPASSVYNEAGILQISAGATNPVYTDRRLWNVFRVCGRDDQQGSVAAGYLAQAFKDKRIVIIHDKTPYGKGLADEMKKSLNARGVKEQTYIAINPGEKDYTALVSRLKTEQADVVYYGGEQTEAGLILRQMGDQGLNAVLMGGDALVSSEFTSAAGPRAEGTLVTFSPDPRKNPNAAPVVERFTKAAIEPEAYTLYSYATLQVLQKAAEAAKSLDPKKIAAVMHSGVPFETVIGTIAFDEKGDVTNPGFIVYRWEKAPDGKMAMNPVSE